MPELPEVETYVRALEPLLTGKTILKAEVRWHRTIALPDAARFTDLVRGRRFASFGRRGKYILLGLDSGETVIVHLRMTGELRLHPPAASDPGSAASPADKHTHVLFELDTGEELRFRDMRKFGRIWLVEDTASVVGKLGPEPLEEAFVPRTLAENLAGRKANIKALLLNQTVLAGVGNIYADESLFRARIDPRRAGGSLDFEEIERLHLALREVLLAGIEAQGSSLQNYAPPTGAKGGFQEKFQVFRRGGEPCFRCGASISRTVLGQRSTHFCPDCQK
ncbi:MAG: bifunctional DNA-formamidopyrimidine glycosylase/DNA-(apurinic or apyrimidinic site) lyase [Caldilineaceae bacterium SB0665_bin_25]|nr:bifunctional DNA-formamidopyrimidine glycosylase/DNA-(apurinic or apyrimidinic site) lyase [Caldilineaceae bacterium SB0665_bin_25]